MSIDISQIREHFLAALGAGNLEKQIQFVEENFSARAEIRLQLLEMLQDHHNLTDQTDVTQGSPDTGTFGIKRSSKRGFHVPVIERYEIGKKIGEGGFGDVYIAQQTQPISRRIALKVIKPGMDSEEVLARFEIERQILALMDHPCIATIFDAGVTEAGDPFFAMELVVGQRITEFCNQKKLNIKQRLELFLSLCDAIQHAHQKGIIHRDIKPSNVLCTVNDELPTLKVIDFGIAKALNPTINAQNSLTTKLELVGTPLYMAPEQAVPSEMDFIIDTRADIYSLGALLYELLVGVTPIDRDLIKNRDIYGIRESIRETKPIRPSQRFYSFTTGKQKSVCSDRKTGIKPLNHWLRGDLDWIVMKAIEKEPDRRYATAKELRTDIESFLNQKPVIAGPPSSAYRLKKFCQRNWFAISAVSIVMISLMGGLSLAIWQAREAKRESNLANASRQIARYRAGQLERTLVKARTAEANERKLRKEAEARDRFSNQLIYTSNMRLANQSINEGDISGCLAILDRHIPTQNGPDLRGFEWQFLHKVCSKNQRQLQKSDVAFSFSRFLPGGEYLVTASEDGTIYLFNAKTESLVRKLSGHLGMVNFVDISPDSSTFASAGDDGMVRLWQVSDGQQIGCFRAAREYVNRVFFVLEGETLITSTDSGEIKFWDVGTKKMIGQMGEFSNKKHDGIRSRLAVSPDRLQCVAADGFWKAYLFDLRTRKLVRKLDFVSKKGGDSVRRAITFSGDGKMIAAAHGNERITVWDTDSGRVIKSFKGHLDDIQDIVFHPTDNLLVSSDRAGVVRVWRLPGLSPTESKAQWPKYFAGHSQRIWSVDFDLTGERLVTAGKDGIVNIWSAEPPVRHSLDADDRNVHVNWINKEELFVSMSSNTIYWNPGRGTKVPLENLPSSITEIAVSPDGTRIATGHQSGTICVRDANSKQIKYQWNSNAIPISELSFTNDGTRVVSGGTNPHIHVWNVESNGKEKEFSLTKECESIAISPNDQWISIASQNDIHLHPLDNVSSKKRLTMHKNTAEDLEFDPSGSHLVSVGDDRTIRIWNTSDWTQKHAIQQHKYDIASVAISPDGQTIASGDDFGNLLFSHLETGRPLYSVNMHRYWPEKNNSNPPTILDLQFSSDGRLAVAVRQRGVIILDGRLTNQTQ